jgi:peptidylglycine monooxygenase
VVALSPDGRRISAWGGEEVADGHMLTFHPDGRIFVVDRDAHEITVFDRAGKRLRGLGKHHCPGEPLNAPCDAAFASDGTIYVADGDGASVMHRFLAEGTLLGHWGELCEAPGQFATSHGIWVLPDGRVAVADRENNRVQVFNAEGRWLADWREYHKPMSMCSAAGGGLYVTDQMLRLTLLDGTGAITRRCRPAQNGAHGMWAAPVGLILLSEISPPRLTRLVPLTYP